MITESDFLRLPFTPDLTEGGIAYAIRSLPFTYDRMRGSSFNRLRRIVAGVAVELAFRRYLSQHDIPFDVKGATPFTDPDRYDVALGGHRCDVKSFLISQRNQVTSLRTNPELLLKAPALVPLDQHSADGHREDDLYIFAFLAGLTTTTPADMQKAFKADQQVYIMHSLPKTWANPFKWVPLAPIALKSEADLTLSVEIGGLTENRKFMTRRLELPPRKRIRVEDCFYSLAFLHIDQIPTARIGLHSPHIEESYIVDPFAWGNIWIYGLDLFLMGYLTYDEFRRRANLIKAGSQVFQYRRTRTKNLAVPVGDLRPLETLFNMVRDWEATQKMKD